MSSSFYEDARAIAGGREIVADDSASVLLSESLGAHRLSRPADCAGRARASTVLSILRKTPRIEPELSLISDAFQFFSDRMIKLLNPSRNNKARLTEWKRRLAKSSIQSRF